MRWQKDKTKQNRTWTEAWQVYRIVEKCTLPPPHFQAAEIVAIIIFTRAKPKVEHPHWGAKEHFKWWKEIIFKIVF